MQAKFVALAVFLCFVSAVAAADSITAVTPSSIPFGSLEEFITITGQGLIGAQSTVVAFDSGEDVEAGSVATSNGIDSVTVGVPPGVALAAGTHTFTVIATDAEGVVRRIGPGTLTVGASPGEGGPPLISAPETVLAEAESVRGTAVTFDVTASSFDGTPLAVTCSPESGSLFPLGATAVTCSAQDAYGTARAEFSVFVTDTTPPVLVLPADIESDSTEIGYTASALDNLDGQLPATCSPASGSVFPAGRTTVSCYAVDSHFNYAFGSFNVTVANGRPALTVPDDVHAEATSANGAAVTYVVSATGGGTVACSPASGSQFHLGATEVNCTATNAFGTDSARFFVIVVDQQGPVLSLPTRITVDATSANGAVVTYDATANDVVEGPATPNCSPASGSLFPIGDTIVTCTVFDSLDNLRVGQFVVTVRDFDRIPPEITVADVTVEATSPAGAVVVYQASAFDNVDGVVPVSCTPASGGTFPLGVTSVQCSATDAHGNTGTARFSVTVRDTTRPVISSVTANPNKLWPPNHKMVTVTVSVTATDLVSTPVNKIVSVSSNQPANGNGDGNTATDWVITGPLTVQLRRERTGSSDRIYTITVESKDAAGNRATKATTVVVTNK